MPIHEMGKLENNYSSIFANDSIEFRYYYFTKCTLHDEGQINPQAGKVNYLKCNGSYRIFLCKMHLKFLTIRKSKTIKEEFCLCEIACFAEMASKAVRKMEAHSTFLIDCIPGGNNQEEIPSTVKFNGICF